MSSFGTDGVIGVSAEPNCGRLLLSRCENVVDVDRHKHREGAAMKYFAGLDVSLEETAICIVDEVITHPLFLGLETSGFDCVEDGLEWAVTSS